MVTWEKIRHQVAVAGRVTDDETKKAIGGALVKITDAPEAFTDWLAVRAEQYGDRWETMVERPDQTITVADGHFHFMDLPDGAYTLTAELPGYGTRYGTAEVEATVERDADGNITMSTADITLTPTSVKGRITNNEGSSVLMAEVRVKGSGERTFSDGNGEYSLTGLEAGSRTVQVSAQGHQPKNEDVQLGEGDTETLNFALVSV